MAAVFGRARASAKCTGAREYLLLRQMGCLSLAALMWKQAAEVKGF